MNKKVTLSIGILVLVAAVIFAFVALKPKKEEAGEANKQEMANQLDELMGNDAINNQIEPLKQMWFFEEKDHGVWSLEEPFFNPFMTEEAYDAVALTDEGNTYLSYIDAYAQLIERTVYGRFWALEAPYNESFTEEENVQLIYDIETYIQRKNGKVLGRYNDTVSFECVDQDIHWYGQIEADGEKFMMQLVRENAMPADQEIVINPSDYDTNTLYYTSYQDGTKLQSMDVHIEGGGALVQVLSQQQYGEYSRDYDQSRAFSLIAGTDFYMDDLPLSEGWQQWVISWDEYAPPSKIKLELKTIGQVPEVKNGEALGAIKISAEFVDYIEVSPHGQRFLSLGHPEYNADSAFCDKTPDGDHIIYVPSGVWDVIVHPKGDALVTQYVTNMVPVNTGQVTEVIIPPSISSTLKVSSGFEERGLAIYDVTEKQDQVAFTFTLLDKETKSILPSIENTMVHEGGQVGEIISIKPVQIPPNVVLLLDSSGSMKGQMEATLTAAKAFINSLPDNTKIQVIDFDTKPKLLEGSDKATVLKNMASIQVNGATCLYDSIIEGTKLLSDADRPILVVFTDGADANANDTARGSIATKEEAMESVKEADIPLFTIGFGKNPDVATLTDFATLTEGRYYAAGDQMVLAQVFEAINNKLTSTYELTYKRPTAVSKSDVPVVSFVIDTSGSMGEEEEGVGSRLIKVQHLLHDFVLALPDEIQMEVTIFSDDTSIVQTLTTDKNLVIGAIGDLVEGGGTDIAGSVETAYQTLKSVPSSKKIMLYITDAALGTTGADQDFLDTLGLIGESDISSLWVGMGVGDAVADFQLTAELSNGDYVVTNDVEELKSKFDVLLNEVIKTPPSELSNIFMSVEKTNPAGEREIYTASKFAKLTHKEEKSEVSISEAIKYVFSDMAKQYDMTTASKISGADLPGSEVVITARMDVDAEGHNQAANIHVNELFALEMIDGVPAPSGYHYLALDISIDNILKEQEVMVYPDGSGHPSAWVSGGNKGKIEKVKIAYMIPDFISHFYITYNDLNTLPASTVTWLMEEPLVEPGNHALTIAPDQSKHGIIAFIVPDELMNQASLHLYDTNYGHIDVPVVGIMKHQWPIEELPKTVSTNLSDTFGLAITGYKDVSTLGKQVVVPPDNALRVVDGNFTSQMQALIDINPSESMKMRIQTMSGDFYIPVSPATNILPSGFSQPRMMAPGAQNAVKWVFQLPLVLKEASADLFIDLFENDKQIAIKEGTKLGQRMNLAYSHDYFDLIINDVVKVNKGFKDSYSPYIIADITIKDKKDGFATTGIMSLFSVVRDEYFDVKGGDMTITPEESKGLSGFAVNNTTYDYIKFPDRVTEDMLLGLSDDTVVYDGTSRRGFIAIEIPESEEDLGWQLYSPMIKDLRLKVNEGTFDNRLAVNAMPFEIDTSFEEAMSGALAAAIERYQLTHPGSGEGLVNGTITLKDPLLSKVDVPAPMISLYGRSIMDSIASLDQLIDVMSRIRVIPSSHSQKPFENTYSAEAFFAQGYGTEQDFANAAMKKLTQLGYTVRLQPLSITSRGKKLLQKISGLDEIHSDYLPSLRITTEDNRERLLILPFMVFADEVPDIARVGAQEENKQFSELLNLSVTLVGEYTEKNVQSQIADMSNALGGDTEGELITEVEMFNESLPMDTLSLDAIDIGIGVNGQNARAYVITADGEKQGTESINPDQYKIHKMIVTFTYPNGESVVHQSEYAEDMPVNAIFLTASINAPDLSEKAAQFIEKTADDVYAKAESPNEISALKWYARSMLLSFIKNQTEHDRALAKRYDLITGRVDAPRILVVSTKNNRGTIETTLDLVQPFDQVHKGTEDKIHSFNMMTGLFASSLESQVLHQGEGLEEIWSQLPKETKLLFLARDDYGEWMDALQEIGVDEDLVNYLAESGQNILIPSKPAVINGRKRWAWLEMNPDNFQTISVLDDFSRGAAVESAVMDIATSSAKYAMGAFIGVDASIWSVAAFSLEEDDYKVILEKAKAFALGIGNQFSVSEGKAGISIGGTASISQNVGPISLSFDGKFNASQSVLGYAEGYAEGVNLYFDVAK